MTDLRAAAPSVLCWGEILWDVLPTGTHPGGAPFNVAYHLALAGCAPLIVSAVGADARGTALLTRLAHWQIDAAGLRRDPVRPTGEVHASLDAAGNAHYEIRRDVAWDEIAPGPAVFAAATTARACVFGSLAQRSAANLAWLEQLFGALPPQCLRIFDVNLREPHDSPALVTRLARHATLIKLNAAEAARLARGDGTAEEPGAEEADARVLAHRWRVSSVVVTAGGRGAGWLRDEMWHWEPAQPVKVVDTVGAGDAFLASLISRLLLRPETPPAAMLAAACRAGEWVVSQSGATPLRAKGNRTE